MLLPDLLEHMQLGWWSGISGNLSDPYGLIIRISAEHGRYVARSYDTRQLASDGHGFPIFEIYFAEANGEYKLQVQCFMLNIREIACKYGISSWYNSGWSLL